MQAKYREEVLNVVLAQRLAGSGLSATPESVLKDLRRKKTALPDVLVLYRGMRLAIEAKYSDAPQAESLVSRQAISRIEAGISQISLAIIYPRELGRLPFAQLDGAMDRSSLRFSVHSEVGLGGWRDGKVADVVNEIRRVHETLCTEDIVQAAAESIRGCLDGLARLFELKAGVCEELATVLGIESTGKEDAETRQRRQHTVTRIAALTLENAFIFQEQLASSGVPKVRSLRQQIGQPDFVTKTVHHWQWICKNINYVPIFQLAATILSKAPANAASDGAVRVLAEKALEVSSNQAALRHDLMGRIYHFLLHEAKYLGTYYTSVPAATLLSKLCLNPTSWPGIDFGEQSSYLNLRVVDLTCGTGTLLMAATQSLADNFILERAKSRKPVTDNDMGELHAKLMENVMHGFDVLPSAIHLTASTLSLLAPEVHFHKLHLHSMPLSVKGERALLGSLEFIEQARVATQFSLFEEESANSESRKYSDSGPTGSTAELPRAQLFIMNPPFTRSVGDNLLFGNLPEAKRNVMQAALKQRVSSSSLSASITAGLGGVFACIADKYLEPDGRLAFVLPAALATGIAWESTRKMLQKDYHIEFVVVSHEPGRWNFSENTDLSEILFVARKLRQGEVNQEMVVSFVNLWRNPTNSGEALALARLIRSKKGETGPLTELGEMYGDVMSVPMRQISGNWWPTAFAQSELALLVWDLRNGKFRLPGLKKTWSVPMIELGSLAELGPDRRDVHDGFEPVTYATSFRAFWNHDAGKAVCIAQKSNKFLSPRKKPAAGRMRVRNTEQLWPKAGALLMAERLRLNTQRLSAVCLPHDVLTNTWWPVRLIRPDKRKEKALALWQNSSFGLAIIALTRVATEGSWVQFKKPSLMTMPILNVDTLQLEQLEALEKTFNQLGRLQLQPMSKQTEDDVRIAIDLALASTLGLPDPTALREMLAREPVFTNKPLLPIEHPATRIKVAQFELALF